MRDRVYYVYLLASRPHGTLSCGVTNDLVRRVAEHRSGGADSFTRRYNVFRLVWYEAHSEIAEAILREKRIKRWVRPRKYDLINALNPTWRDLAEDFGFEPLVLAPRKAGPGSSPG